MVYGEVGCLMKYVQDQLSKNPSFYHANQMDMEEQITNVFWVDSRMLIDYVSLAILCHSILLIVQIMVIGPLSCSQVSIIIEELWFLVHHFFMMKQQHPLNGCLKLFWRHTITKGLSLSSPTKIKLWQKLCMR